MLNKLLSAVRQYAMLSPGDTLICAVSGGADSIAMLYGFYLLKEKLHITLEAAHFDHGLRGEESRRDARFVMDFCSHWDIPLHLSRGNVVAGEKGLEAAAREARYGFLQTLSGKIATAHTANDNAETLLMHLVRGTGLKGLGGISPIRGKLIRPMLSVTRQEVLSFLEEYHLSWVEDSSNESDAFLRNRLRHRVMPLLMEENPRLAENLSQTALRLRRDEEALSQLPDFSGGLDVKALRALPPARQDRILASYLIHCGVKEPEARHIALASSLAFSQIPSARGYFPGGVILTREYDLLIPAKECPPFCPIRLQVPSHIPVPALGITVSCREAKTIENSREVFTVCPQGELMLRPRQAGDRIALPGGSRSLKKLFIDRKIPAQNREHIPVLADEEGVLAVYGIGANRDRMAKTLPAITIEILPLMPGDNKDRNIQEETPC